jgi:cytochrome c oxidase subunit 2
MRFLSVAALLMVAACGGAPSEPAAPPAAPEPAPAPVEAAPAPAAEAKPDLAAMSEEDRKAWLMKRGEVVYTQGGPGGIACITCHGPEGKGTPPAFPPLAGQKAIMGDCAQHAGIVVHGLNMPITVDGVQYTGAMPAQGTMSDEDIAAVITYERMSWGNDAGPCLPADVAKARTSPPPVLK